MKELHKNNENILTGLMDTETELEDALTGIDEIRASQLNTESFVKNITAFTAVRIQKKMRKMFAILIFCTNCRIFSNKSRQASTIITKIY